jgi:hypothetical protein
MKKKAPSADLPSALTTDKYREAALKSYSSLTQLANVTGLDIRVLKAAKKIDLASAFTAAQGVNWKKLKPILENEYAALVAGLDKVEDTFSKEMQELELRQARAKTLKMERALLEPAAVKKWVIELAAKHSVVITKELNEIPPRGAGRSEPELKVMTDRAMKAIFDVMGDTSGIRKLENAP